MRKMTLCILGLFFFILGTAAWAASGVAGGIGTVAQNVTDNLGQVAQLITAASYVAGMAFAVGAIVKFKAHKDNPTQIPIGTPIALLFVGAALIFIPSIFKVSGKTLFGESGVPSSVSGITTFESKAGGGGT